MFIPMCIGNTALEEAQTSLDAVYPYVYREHF